MVHGGRGMGWDHVYGVDGCGMNCTVSTVGGRYHRSNSLEPSRISFVVLFLGSCLDRPSGPIKPLDTWHVARLCILGISADGKGMPVRCLFGDVMVLVLGGGVGGGVCLSPWEFEAGGESLEGPREEEGGRGWAERACAGRSALPCAALPSSPIHGGRWG
ncbi:uncharacterized protein BO66DRAFT_145215 [Aspergillus aculeatinus CBS 121060]|uniref:Uncharacterized protein n=1 Tax=Aspergillus aculeatinus CBS 121060 TaxID=1448322 RepID=A0ACD1HKC4_9EURO|nr:hypothetical protein BO66DRAFT_145215 [Aspergillus aculeatinus CBS 121060]RAH74258.1 hypothetical protein BO66DRAFT_145215 [Aspergillus aculeatinus CBS 121060]